MKKENLKEGKGRKKKRNERKSKWKENHFYFSRKKKAKIKSMKRVLFRRSEFVWHKVVGIGRYGTHFNITRLT